MSTCQGGKRPRQNQLKTEEQAAGSKASVLELVCGACDSPEAVLHASGGSGGSNLQNLLFIRSSRVQRRNSSFGLGVMSSLQGRRANHWCLGLRCHGFQQYPTPFRHSEQTHRQNMDSLIWNKRQSRKHTNVSAYVMIIDFLNWF